MGLKLPKSIGGTYHRNRQQLLWWAIFIYTFLLLMGNLVEDRSLQIFYFTFSPATLLLQVVFCGTVCFTEILGFRRTAQVIWFTTLLNFAMGMLVYYYLANPLPDFWVKQGMVSAVDPYHRLYVIIMFSIGYLCSTLVMVGFAGMLKAFFKGHWLFLRVILVTLAGMIVDLSVLFPIVIFVTPDTYMATWKMLSLVSIKLVFCLFAIPLSYGLILFFKKKRSYS